MSTGFKNEVLKEIENKIQRLNKTNQIIDNTLADNDILLETKQRKSLKKQYNSNCAVILEFTHLRTTIKYLSEEVTSGDPLPTYIPGDKFTDPNTISIDQPTLEPLELTKQTSETFPVSKFAINKKVYKSQLFYFCYMQRNNKNLFDFMTNPDTNLMIPMDGVDMKSIMFQRKYYMHCIAERNTIPYRLDVQDILNYNCECISNNDVIDYIQIKYETIEIITGYTYISDYRIDNKVYKSLLLYFFEKERYHLVDGMLSNTVKIQTELFFKGEINIVDLDLNGSYSQEKLEHIQALRDLRLWFYNKSYLMTLPDELLLPISI